MDPNQLFVRQLVASQPSTDPNVEFIRGMTGDMVRPSTPRQVQDIGDSIIAGLQASSGGLAYRGKKPELVMPEDAPIQQRLGAAVGGIMGDVPAMIAGGTVAAMATKNPIAMGAATFAAPMALRAALMEAYGNKAAVSWEGAWDVAKASVIGGAKGAVIGGLTAGAGKYIEPLLQPLGKVAATGGTLAAELTALTTSAAALEGHLPTAQDFLDNAILLGGLKGSMAVARNLRMLYSDTGVKPDEAFARALADPELKAALLSGKQLPADIIELSVRERVKAALIDDPTPELFRQMLMKGGTEGVPKLGESPLAAKSVKWDYIIGPGDVKALALEMEGHLRAKIQEQTRGVVTDKQVATEALRRVVDGEIAERVIGQAPNAEAVMVRAMLIDSAVRDLKNVMAELGRKAEVDLTLMDKLKSAAAFERVGMVIAEFRGERAEAGRALRIYRVLKSDLSVIPEAENLMAMYAKHTKGTFGDLSKLVTTFKDPAQLARFAEELHRPGMLEKVVEGWKASILSGPLTHMANMVGNLTKLAVEVPESVLSATIQAGRQYVKGDPMSLRQYSAKAFAPWHGLQLGLKDSVYHAVSVLTNDAAVLDKADVYRHAISGLKGEVIRTPFRFLAAEDALFRTWGERAKAYEMAVDRAAREKVMPGTREWNETVQTYLDKPGTRLDAEHAAKVKLAIEEVGSEAVFSQRLGPHLEMLQRAMSGTGMEFVVPFVRTPANLVSWAMQHTPGFNLLSGRWRRDFAAGGERQSRAIARVMIGTVLTAWAYDQIAEGNLSGGGMFTPELKKTKMAAGWQPYSVKIGDSWYSYQRMEPVAKVLGIAADLHDMIQTSNKDEDRATMGAMLITLFGNATISTTYLSGLSNMVQALADPERFGGTVLEQYSASLVPKIIGQPVQLADPYFREVDGAMQAIQSQLPWLREKLLPKRDVWGDPRPETKAMFVLPIAKSEITTDKVKAEAERLQIAIQGPPKYVMESGPFSQRQQRIELTQEQKDIFAQVSGREAMALLTDFVGSPDWKRTPEYVKIGIFKEAISGAREIARYSALPIEAPERLELRHKILDKIIQQEEAVEDKPKKRVIEVK